MEKIFEIDWRVLLIQIGGFALLVVVFKLFLFGPISDALRSRQEEISSTYETAESEKAKMEALRQDYERRLNEIESEAREKINASIKEGQVMRDEILGEAREKAEAIVLRGEMELARERDKTLAQIREEVVDLALEAASKLVEQSLDEKAHRKLVSDFINDLEVRK